LSFAFHGSSKYLIIQLGGIYIHIPFCKQACHYCNFHFTTSLRRKNELVAALLDEIEQRKDYLKGEVIQTIYFGGGTPSLLQIADIGLQIEKIKQHFTIADDPEVTIEVNPDDINEEKLTGWRSVGINRLSIGVQSFFDEDLKWMNRIHNRQSAISSLQLTKQHFENISIDLIYGLPHFSNERWKENVETAVSFDIPQLSCYALTVEEKTPLFKMIRSKKVSDVVPDKQSEQFLLLMDWLGQAGYEHYEISNFAKPGSRSRHNSSYWSGEKYLGIGPSAHSFDGNSRQWNISNNNIYIDSISRNIIPFEKEILTETQKLNEYIMTSLRTIEGLSLTAVSEAVRYKLQAASEKYIQRGWMIEEGQHLRLTKEGKLLADGIAAELFFEHEGINK
jgi:oxygen-independent coproporphyrinogen III oxidase